MKRSYLQRLYASTSLSDVTPPTLSNPTANATGTTTATIGVDTNEANGNLYWHVSTSATPPTATALKAGTGAYTFGVTGVVTGGTQTITVGGLTNSTVFYAYFLQRDAAGNDSSIVSASFATSATPSISTRFASGTPAGTGGVPVPTGATIASGNSANHFTVTSNVLVGTTTGATAGYNAGPYALTLTDGTLVSIEIIAGGGVHVRTQTEWDALDLRSTTTRKGKTIYLRPNSYRGGGTILSRIDGGTPGATAGWLKNADYLGIVIEGDNPAIDNTSFPPVRFSDPCTIDKWITVGARNIGIRKLATTRVAETKLKWQGQPTNNTYGILVDQCHISGVAADPYGDYSISTNYPNIGVTGITSTGGNDGCTGSSTFTNNVVEHFEFLYYAHADRPGDATVTCTGNFFQYAYSDSVHITNGAGTTVTTAIVTDNSFRGGVGKFSDSQSPHGDAIQLQGNKTSTQDMTVYIGRNYISEEGARGGMHGIFCSSFKIGTANSGHVFNGTIEGNLYVGDHVDAITVSQVGTLTAINNTCVQINNTTTDNQVTIRLGGTGDAYSVGTQTLQNNVADYINTANLTAPVLANNVILGQGGATISYSTAFAGVGGFTTAPANRAAALAKYAPKVGGPLDLVGTHDVGAVGYTTWSTTIPGSDGSTPGTSTVPTTTDTTAHTADSTLTTVDRA